MKKVLKYLCTFIVLIMIYIVCLTLISLIPRKMIKDNSTESAYQLLEDYIDEKQIIFRDYFTDPMMIDLAYNMNSKDAFKSAMTNNVRSIKEGIDFFDDYKPILALCLDLKIVNYSDFDELIRYNYTYSYARFWHGYLIVLKPLLVLLNYNQIIGIHFLLFLILFVILGFLLYKKKNLKVSMIFLMCLISIGFFEIPFSMSLYPAMLIAMVYSIYILVKDKKIKDIKYAFFINGSITCFFNWMTITPLTFGIPYLVYYVLNNKDNNKIRIFIKSCITYSMGFICTWIAKWCLTDLLFSTNIIQNALEQVLLRVSNDGMGVKEKINYFDVLIINIYYMIVPIILITIYILVGYCIKIFRNDFSFKRGMKKIKDNIVLLLIGLIPFFIFLITLNHSFIHALSYSHRLLILTEIILLLLWADIDKEDKLHENDN